MDSKFGSSFTTRYLTAKEKDVQHYEVCYFATFDSIGLIQKCGHYRIAVFLLITVSHLALVLSPF